MLLNKQRFFVVIVAIFTFLSYTACVKKGPQEVSKTEILIGEYGSMTGSESTFGTQTHKGLMLAVNEINAQGGIQGKKLRVISYDDQGKSDEAITAVTKLITQDKVQLLIGEVASSRSIAAGAIAQEYKVPMITPSSTNPRVTKIGDQIFRVCFIDPFQGAVMAKFALDNLKKTKAAILRDTKSDYSVGLADFFKKEFLAKGGTIVEDRSYQSGDIDFKAQLNAIKNLPDGKKAEVLFIPGYYTEVGLIARQAHEMKLNSVLLGGDGWDSDKLTEIGQKGIIGGLFSTHYAPDDKSPLVQKFVLNYKKAYKETPTGLAAMGYEAGLFAADALKKTQDHSPQGIREALSSIKNFQGIVGNIIMDNNRDAIKPAIVLKVVGSNKYEFVTTVKP